MPLRSLAFLAVLVGGCALGVLYHPLINVLLYLANYMICPTGQWWGVVLFYRGIRYGKLIAASLALGLLVHWGRLPGRKGLCAQELLLIALLAIVWLSHLLGLPPGPMTVRNAVKMTKIVLVLLMVTRVVVTLRGYEAVVWTLVAMSAWLGYAALTAPPGAYFGGRLNIGIGGPDFREGNFLAAHFAMVLSLIGAMFLKGKRWQKLVCVAAAALVINGIVLTRSRGAFLACLAGGAFAAATALVSLRRYRARVLLLLAAGCLGTLMLVDPGFWRRMATLRQNPEETDPSARGRVLAWRAAVRMALDHPLGIGEGNFFQYVGRYDERIPRKDTHNTFFRCLAELGFPGAFVYLMLVVGAFRTLRWCWRASRASPRALEWRVHVWALATSLVTFLTAGLFITHTYTEELYWLLMFPVCLRRGLENELEGGSR